MKKIINILLLILMVMAASCSKFLEPQSQTQYVPRDVNALNELLLGSAYVRPDIAGSFMMLNEILADDWACATINGNNSDNANQYTRYKPLFTWHPHFLELLAEKGIDANIWKRTYTWILGCNAVLDYIDGVAGSEEDKNYVKGQAYALRAFYYFHLVNLYGEPYNYNKQALGVPLKLDSDQKPDYPVRATVEQVYNQISKDLDLAEASFKALPTSKQFIKTGRINLPMVQMLKAKVALFKEDYNEVITYANKVVNDWGLSLLDLNSFTATSAVPYYPFSSYDNPEALWMYGNTANDMTRFARETIKINPTTTAARSMFNAAPSLLNSFATNDLRKANYILNESTTLKTTFLPMGKVPVNSAYAPLTDNFAKAVRVSEAYMMLAEAYYFNNQPALAVQMLEAVRQKRYKNTSGTEYKVPVASTTGTALLDFIKAERRRELCYENGRWYDLRRWGMESFSRDWKEDTGTGTVTTATFTMLKNDPAYTLPVPQTAMEKNPELVQNKLATPKY